MSGRIFDGVMSISFPFIIEFIVLQHITNKMCFCRIFTILILIVGTYRMIIIDCPRKTEFANNTVITPCVVRSDLLVLFKLGQSSHICDFFFLIITYVVCEV